ncbi:hypothetical protein J6590_005190 [Homalodisca vitripennis]|nr:hypothetical protein J6590_005190 [Homalodisca vitripennis]
MEQAMSSSESLINVERSFMCHIQSSVRSSCRLHDQFSYWHEHWKCNLRMLHRVLQTNKLRIVVAQIEPRTIDIVTTEGKDKLLAATFQPNDLSVEPVIAKLLFTAVVTHELLFETSFRAVVSVGRSSSGFSTVSVSCQDRTNGGRATLPHQLSVIIRRASLRTKPL